MIIIISSYHSVISVFSFKIMFRERQRIDKVPKGDENKNVLRNKSLTGILTRVMQYLWYICQLHYITLLYITLLTSHSHSMH